MKEFDSRGSRQHLKWAVLLAAVIGGVFVLSDRDSASGQVAAAPATLHTTEDKPIAELAPHMGELQRLTHKLSLAVNYKNYPLASFYLYESLETLENIKTNVPEYRGLPVALLIDQLSTKRYEDLKQALKHDEAGSKPERAPASLATVVASCNQCHVATKHGFIKISDRADFNPFNQDFKP